MKTVTAASLAAGIVRTARNFINTALTRATQRTQRFIRWVRVRIYNRLPRAEFIPSFPPGSRNRSRNRPENSPEIPFQNSPEIPFPPSGDWLDYWLDWLAETPKQTAHPEPPPARQCPNPPRKQNQNKIHGILYETTASAPKTSRRSPPSGDWLAETRRSLRRLARRNKRRTLNRRQPASAQTRRGSKIKIKSMEYYTKSMEY